MMPKSGRSKTPQASNREWSDRRTRAERDRAQAQAQHHHGRLVLPDDDNDKKRRGGGGPALLPGGGDDDGGSVAEGSLFGSVVDSILRRTQPKTRQSGGGDDDDDGTMVTIGTRMTVDTRGTLGTIGEQSVDTSATRDTEQMGSLMSKRRGWRSGRAAAASGGRYNRNNDDDDEGTVDTLGTFETLDTLGNRIPLTARGRRTSQSQTVARLVLLVMALCCYVLFQTANTGEIMGDNVERMHAGELMEAARVPAVSAEAWHAAAKYGTTLEGEDEGDAFDTVAGGEGVRKKEVYGASVIHSDGAADQPSRTLRKNAEEGGGNNQGDASSRLQKALAARQKKRQQRGGGGTGYGLVGIGAVKEEDGKDGAAAAEVENAAEAPPPAAEAEADAPLDGDDGSCTPLPSLHDPLQKHREGYLDYQNGFVNMNRETNYDWDWELTKQRGLPDGPKNENGKPYLPRFVTLDGGRGSTARGANLAFGERKSEKGHVMTDQPLGYAWNGTGAIVGRDGDESGFEPPTEELMDSSNTQTWKRTELKGDYVTFVGWFQGNYGHFVHDHLPIIAWLKEHALDKSPGTKLLLYHHPRDENTLRTVDAEFVRDRVVWVQPGKEVVTIKDGSLGVLVMRTPGRNSKAVRSLRRWLVERFHAKGGDVTGRRTVIYHTRGGSKDNMHGRVVDALHEADIVALVRRKMLQHRLDATGHKLVIFDGQEGGKTMSVPRQMEVFGTATSMIGPHGSGLANTVWMMGWGSSGDGGGGGNARACPEVWGGPSSVPLHRPQVLEYLLGPDSLQVQDSPGPYTRSHYHIYSTAMWAEWRHVLYAGNSTSARTFVNLDAMGEALDAMWGGRF